MNNLRIVLMNGGLGNQLYQYAFSRFLEGTTGVSCFIDDTRFCLDNFDHNGYELEKVFNLKLNLLSRNFSENVWKEIMQMRAQKVSTPQILSDYGINLTLLAEFDNHGAFNGNTVYIPANKVTQEMLYIYTHIKGNFYYHGYWASPDYFLINRESLLQELVFPDFDFIPELSVVNRQYAARIEETDSVALHIRRGDYISWGLAVSEDKYCNAVKEMERKYAGCTYFVFSDDIPWCKEHRKELGLADTCGEVIYVTGNNINANNYIDMQLMSKCKKMILTGTSTFSHWAYYLNRNSDIVHLTVK